MALLFYPLVNNQVEYDESVWAEPDAQRQARREAQLKEQARPLGYELVRCEALPAA